MRSTIFALIITVAIGCNPTTTTQPPRNANPSELAKAKADADRDAKWPMPRDEFRKAVMGKTTAEVLKFAGKPESTSDTGTWQSWRYINKTTDPVTGKIDASLRIRFDNDGRVENVNFY